MFDTPTMRTHPRALLPRLTKLLLVLALTLSLGAHWLALQSVAWVGMVVNFSQTAPFHEAINKTFDGRHPCALCKMVREGKAKEQKQDALKTMTKQDMVMASHQLFLSAPIPFPLVTTATMFPSVWRDTPPTPPPRFA